MHPFSSQTIACYNTISESFSKTRSILRWKGTLRFIESLSDGFSILDVGCGNGELLSVLEKKFPNSIRFGCDASEGLLAIAKTKSNSTFFEHVLPTPISNLTGKVDYVSCIAVLGHLLTEQERIDSLKAMLDVLNDNGKLFLIVWCEESILSKSSTSKYEQVGTQLYRIPFYDRFNTKQNQDRYYYLFANEELERLINSIKSTLPYEVSIDYLYREEGNDCALLSKKNILV